MKKLIIFFNNLPLVLKIGFLLIVIFALLIIIFTTIQGKDEPSGERKPELTYEIKSPSDVESIKTSLPFRNTDFYVEYDPQNDRYYVTFNGNYSEEVQMEKVKDWFLSFPDVTSTDDLDILYFEGLTYQSDPHDDYGF